DAQEISPARIGLQGANKNSNVAWITGDFNTDSYGDLLVAAPELSRLHLYFGNAQGLAPEPKGIDTLSSVTRISRLSTGDMIVVSKKEKIAAIHSIDDITRFPTILNLPGSVIAGCGIEASTDSWFICKNEDKELQLARIERTDGEKTSIYPLDIKNDPNDLLAFQLPDRKVGLILFMPYALPKMYLFANEQLDPLTSESFRALSRQLTLSNIRMEAPGDGAVLTVAQGAIARRFEWKGDRYEVTRQFNPENPQGEMVASCNYALADGSTGTFFYDRNTGELIRFSAANKGWGKIHIPDADQTIFDLVQLQNKKRDSIVLIDRTGINEILGNGSRLAPIANAEYVSPAEDPMLAYVDTVNLGSPPRPMIALVDHANRTIELVSQHDDELKTDLVFEVFLVSDFVNPSNSRGTEPHGIESGDLNGDNIGDLVILCQDKLLIYMGE
ncbi:MAG: hypothetical protein OEL75_04620, partial [Kiritimatiellaceae bacterium]|nr:hypothetical protein [Kiritimatiellaceae bacterium]